jgi:hypothetical protein
VLSLAARSIAIAITARQRSELSTTGLTIGEDADAGAGIVIDALDAVGLDRVRCAMDIVADEVCSTIGATAGSAISRHNDVCGYLLRREEDRLHAQASAPSLRSRQAAEMPKQAT